MKEPKVIEKDNSKVYFYWIDALRFLAAFMVLFSHSRNDFFVPFGELPIEQQTYSAYAFYSLGRLGHEAVVVFFVLSGFLVGGVNLERIFKGTFTPLSYIIDRCVRIYLPLLASIVLYFIVCQVIGDDFDYICAIGNIFNLQCTFVEPLVSVYWSLAYEMWFYIALLGFGLIMSGKKKWIGYCIMLLTCFIFVCGLDLFYLFLWYIGAFAYLVRPQKRSGLILFASFLLMLLSVAYSQLLTDSKSLSINVPLPDNKLIPELLLSVAICTIIQQLILFKPLRKWSIFIEHVFSKLASFSYTLYLSHRIFFLILFHFFFTQYGSSFTLSGVSLYVLFVFIVLLLCYGLYRISEYYTYQVKVIIKRNLL